MISLTASLEATYTLWPRDARRAKSQLSTSSPAIIRTFSAQASCCAPSGCRRGRWPSALHSAGLAHALGALGIIVIGTQSPGTRDLVLTITAATARRISFVSTACPTPRACATRSLSPFRKPTTSTCTARRATSAISRTISPSRSAPSFSNEMRHEIHPQRQERRRGAGSRPSACAHCCAKRDVSGSRRAAMRETAAPAPSGSTAHLSIVASCRRCARRGATSRRSKGWHRAMSCIRCSRRFSTRRPSSAASAPPA